MNQKIKLFPMLAIIFLFSACVTPIGMTERSSLFKDGQTYEKQGEVEGCNGSFAVLGLYSIGRPDIDHAIKDALKKKNGDALINVRLYQRTMWFVVLTYTDVIVKGESVKFISSENDEAKSKKKRRK